MKNPGPWVGWIPVPGKLYTWKNRHNNVNKNVVESILIYDRDTRYTSLRKAKMLWREDNYVYVRWEKSNP